MRARGVGFAGLCAGDLAALIALRPDFGSLVRRCADLPRWIALVGADRAVVALAAAVLWCAAAWLALGLLAAGATTLPGSSGRAAAAACRALLPGMLRKLLAGSAGVSVLLTPALASAHPAPASATSSPGAPARTSLAVRGDPLPAPAPPTTTPRTTTAPAAAPTTTAPAPAPPARTGPAPAAAPVWPTDHAAPAARSATAAVRVRPGDSLWLLAAARLGRHATDAQIATYWPRWYALNRNVIGDDPSLITPGQILRVPAPTSRESS